jgi:hypothetical protein
MTRMFWAVRSFLFLLYMAVSVVPWATVVLIVSIFARGDRVYWLCAGWLTHSISAARVICGVRHRMHGLDNLAEANRAPAVIVLPKHQSTWGDAFPGLMPHPLASVQARTAYIPFFGGRWIHDPSTVHGVRGVGRWPKQGARHSYGAGSSCFQAPSRAWASANTESRHAPAVTTVPRFDRDFSALLAAQDIPAATRRDRRYRRSIDPLGGTSARRTDARGRVLDRGRDAAPGSRGLRARIGGSARSDRGRASRRWSHRARAVDFLAMARPPRRPDPAQLSLFVAG